MLTMLPAAVTPLAVAVADKLTSSRVEVVTETIRSLQEETGTQIDVSPEGNVTVASSEAAGAEDRGGGEGGLGQALDESEHRALP